MPNNAVKPGSVILAAGALAACAYLAPRPTVAPPTSADLHTGHFAGTRNGLVVTHATGEVFLTRDGGGSWERGADLPDQHLEAVWLFDLYGGLIAGERGLHRTADGGRTVLPVAGTEGYTIYALQFPGTERLIVSRGYAVGFTAEQRTPVLLRTDDGGYTWHRLAGLPARGLAGALNFDSPERGLVAAGRDLLLTRDGGASWTVVATQIGVVRRIHRAPGGRWWVVGHDGLLRVSADGVDWNAVAHPPQLLRDVHFIDRRNGWLAGDATPEAAPLWRTRDGGMTWTPVEGVTADVHRLLRRGPALVAVGDGGLFVELRR
jgi:photosystem II stability/assembly factor-like uncharacterized protein